MMRKIVKHLGGPEVPSVASAGSREARAMFFAGSGGPGTKQRASPVILAVEVGCGSILIVSRARTCPCRDGLRTQEVAEPEPRLSSDFSRDDVVKRGGLHVTWRHVRNPSCPAHASDMRKPS